MRQKQDTYKLLSIQDTIETCDEISFDEKNVYDLVSDWKKAGKTKRTGENIHKNLACLCVGWQLMAARSQPPNICCALS